MGAYLRGGGDDGGLRARLRALPALYERRDAARRDAVGRRAADGRDGPRADVAPEAAADGRAVDGPRADPRRAELRDHQAGARRRASRARRRAERERLALDRRPRLRALDRPRRARGQGGRPARRTTICGRRTLAVEHARPWPTRCRHRFPIFERLVYVNSCSQGALSDAVRAAYDDYLTRLGRARRAVGLLGRAHRGRARGVRPARRRRRRTRSPSRPRSRPASSALASALDFERAAARRRHRLRVPDRSARSGTRRSRAAPRSSMCRPTARRSRSSASTQAIDERTALVAVTARLLPQRRAAPDRGDRRARARARRARAARRLPGDRHVSDRRPRRSASTSSRAGVLKYLLALGRARRSSGAGASCRGAARRRRPAGSPTANIFEMDIHDYSPSPTARRFQSGTPPVPAIYAGIAGIELMRGDRDRGDAGARERR